MVWELWESETIEMWNNRQTRSLLLSPLDVKLGLKGSSKGEIYGT
jgi:hypothetical protein